MDHEKVIRSEPPPELPRGYLFVIDVPNPEEYACMITQDEHFYHWDTVPGGFIRKGVRWAATMKTMSKHPDGTWEPTDRVVVVAAALDPTDDEFDLLASHTDVVQAQQYYKDGRPEPMGHDGHP